MKITICYLAIVFVFMNSNLSYAGDLSETYYDLREREIYKFSLELFQDAEYYRAITEAKRYISLFPQGKKVENMYKLIGDCYLMAREWSDAIDAYNQFLKHFSKSQYVNQILFNKGICLVKEKKYTEAKSVFQEIIESANPVRKNEAIKWKILLLIHNNNFEELDRLLNDEFIRKELGKTISIIEKTVTVKREVKYKSPELAVFMSCLLPGSGQFYSERYKDGIYSFVLNGLFIAGTYFAVDNENYPVAGILIIFELGWYSGNIYSAANGAHKYNRKIDEDIFKKSIENFDLLEHKVRSRPQTGIFFRFYF